MDQMVQQAFVLRVYEELTSKLYQILKQAEAERQEMETRIFHLEAELKAKDQKIKQLELKICQQTNQSQQNLVKIAGFIQSQPFLGLKQNSNNKQASSVKSFKIDINSYFKELIGRKEDELSTQSNSLNNLSSKRNQQFAKQCESFWQDQDKNYEVCDQKVTSNTNTTKTQTNIKKLQSISSNKQNIQQFSSKTNIFYLSNEEKLQKPTKQKIKHIQEHACNLSNAILNTIKPRKQLIGFNRYLSNHS